MNSLLRRLALICLLPIVATGCVSALGIVKPAARNVQAIEIEGHWKLEGKNARVTDPEEIRRILKLIHKVNGMWRMQGCFDIDREKTQSVEFTLEEPGGPRKVRMLEGVLRAPGEGDTFYTSHKETQKELWDLALQHLGVDDDELVAEKTTSEEADY